MANLKDIRTRIESVNSTKQITSAMKLVSAAKLRRAQEAITQMRPYADKLNQILENLMSGLKDDEKNVYGAVREEKRVLLVLITSNRGLAGGFNSAVTRMAENLIKTNYAEHLKNKNLYFVAIGKKASDFLRTRELKMISSHNELYDELTFDNVEPVVADIMQKFTGKRFDKVELIYNQFKNAAVQILTREPFLPVLLDNKTGEEEPHEIEFILEPSKEYIVEELIPKSLKIQFYKALLDSHAAEHGARMTAMHKATDNATDMVKDLKLTYNKARQASITNEILEIVGGAEALNK